MMIWKDIIIRLVLTLISKIRDAYHNRLNEAFLFTVAEDNRDFQGAIESAAAEYERIRAEEAEQFQKTEEELKMKMKEARQNWKRLSRELRGVIEEGTANLRMLMQEASMQTRDLRQREEAILLRNSMELLSQSVAQFRTESQLFWDHQTELSTLAISATMIQGDLTRDWVTAQHDVTRDHATNLARHIEDHVSAEHQLSRQHLSECANQICCEMHRVGQDICNYQRELAEHIESHITLEADNLHQHLAIVDEHSNERANAILTQGRICCEFLSGKIDRSTAQIINKVEFEGALTRNHMDYRFSEQKALFLACTDQILDGIKVVQIEGRQHYASLWNHESQLSRELDRRANIRHTIQLGEHWKTRSVMSQYHMQDQEWQNRTSDDLKQIRNDVKENIQGQGLGKHIDEKLQLGPLTLGSEDGMFYADVNLGGPHVGLNTKGELKVGYAGSVGVASGSVDAVVPLFNPKATRIEADGAVSAGSMASANAKLVVPIFDLKKSTITGSAQANIPGMKGKVDTHVSLSEIENSYCKRSIEVLGQPWIKTGRPLE
jgi:hypothetical protein